VTQAQPVQYKDYSISGFGRVNVLLGKNGCGKSTALRAIHQAVDEHSQGAQWALAKYITPERSGSLDYDPNIENNISNNPNWLATTRLVNQFGQFKQQTMAQYRQLEIRVSRLFQKAHKDQLPVPPYFSDYAHRINELLDNV
jgi:ABC-type cobalamin/Fe3+-siderophores transport system ATPase subunit